MFLHPIAVIKAADKFNKKSLLVENNYCVWSVTKGDSTMGIKTFNPYTPSRRHMTGSDFAEVTTSTPEKSLVVSLKKNAGRNNQGKSPMWWF